MNGDIDELNKTVITADPPKTAAATRRRLMIKKEYMKLAAGGR